MELTPGKIQKIITIALLLVVLAYYLVKFLKKT